MKRITLGLLLLTTPFVSRAELVGCDLNGPSAMSFPSPTLKTRTLSAYAQVSVRCEAGVPYQVEVFNARRGGSIDLVDTATGQRIPASLIQSDTRAALGALNQGEAMAGVGTGAIESHAFEVRVDLDAAPSAGRYVEELVIVINY